jgi:hypothetical protein
MQELKTIFLPLKRTGGQVIFASHQKTNLMPEHLI